MRNAAFYFRRQSTNTTLFHLKFKFGQLRNEGFYRDLLLTSSTNTPP
jgi:hypothetical protein